MSSPFTSRLGPEAPAVLGPVDLEKTYHDCRNMLNEMGYHDPLPREASPLVFKLLRDCYVAVTDAERGRQAEEELGKQV